MDAKEKISNMVIPKAGMGGDGKISWESYSRRRGYRIKQVQENMEMVSPYLAKRMEVDEDCSADECPTHHFVPLRFSVYYLFCIMKIIIIDAFCYF